MTPRTLALTTTLATVGTAPVAVSTHRERRRRDWWPRTLTLVTGLGARIAGAARGLRFGGPTPSESAMADIGSTLRPPF